MKKLLSLILTLALVLTLFATTAVMASYEGEFKYVKVGESGSDSAMCKWAWSELLSGSSSGDASYSAWYTNAPSAGEAIGVVEKDGKLVYDPESNEGITDSVNPIYKMSFGKKGNTYLIPNASGGIYTWRVPVSSHKITEGKYGCLWGTGVEFYLYNPSLYDKLAFKINYRGGILDGNGNWLKGNEYLQNGREYILDFVVDNTGDVTVVTMYADGELVGTHTYAVKYDRITNFRSYIYPTNNKVWVPVDIKYGTMKLFEGDCAGVSEGVSLDVGEGCLEITGDAEVEYEAVVLKPESGDDGIEAFGEVYSVEDYENASDSEKALMVCGEYTVISDESGKAVIQPEITTPGRYTAFLKNGTSPVEFFVGAETLIENSGEYPEHENFIKAIEACAPMSRADAEAISAKYSIAPDKENIIVLSENDYAKFACAVWWSSIETSEEISNEDAGQLFAWLKKAGYETEEVQWLFSGVADKAKAVSKIDSASNLEDLIANIRAACILTGIEDSQNGFEAIKYIDALNNSRFQSLEPALKAAVASEICGEAFASLNEIDSAIDNMEISIDDADTKPNKFVMCASDAGWQRSWDFSDLKPNDSNGSGYYNNATSGTEGYPANVTEGDELVYSVGTKAGTEAADSAYYVFNNNNSDQTALVTAKQASGGKFTTSFDMTLNGSYGEGFRCILRYNAVAGSARELMAFMVNYKGVVLNQKSEWLTTEGYIKSGVTYHYSIVVDTESKVIDIYVDGKRLGSSAYTDGGSDKQNSLYAISMWYYPRVYGKWTDTEYRFKNLRIESGVHVDGNSASLYTEGGEVYLNAEPGSEFNVRVYKPDSVIPFINSYLSTYSPEDYDYCINNGYDTEIVAMNDFEVMCDENGRALCPVEVCGGGKYFICARMKNGTDVYELSVYNKLELLLENDAESNIKSEEFKTLYQTATNCGDDACNEVYDYANSVENTSAVIALAGGDFSKLYSALLWQKMVEADAVDEDLLKKLETELTAMGVDASGVKLVGYNNSYTDLISSLGEYSGFEEACSSLFESAVLCGIRNVAFDSEADVFLAAIGNSKYNKASKSEKKQIQSAVAKKSFASIEELEDEIDDVRYEKESSGSSGGSGGGGSSQKAPRLMPITPDNGTSKAPDADNSQTFSDVAPSHWAYPGIEKLYRLGIVSGYESKFNPDDSITRAQFVKILCGVFKIKGSDEAVFSDVKPEDWFYGCVNGAAKAGIVLGDGNSFNPDGKITRQDASVMLFRISEKLQQPNSAQTEFADRAEISDYAVSAVDALCAAGIINGYEDGTFRPFGNLTRAEASKLAYGFIS